MKLLLGAGMSSISRNNPYANEQWNVIKTFWNIYKQDIGLEGEIYLELKRKGAGQDIILDAINKHREERNENLEAWRNLRKEFWK